jgi:fatty acid desaturase
MNNYFISFIISLLVFPLYFIFYTTQNIYLGVFLGTIIIHLFGVSHEILHQPKVNNIFQLFIIQIQNLFFFNSKIWLFSHKHHHAYIGTEKDFDQFVWNSNKKKIIINILVGQMIAQYFRENKIALSYDIITKMSIFLDFIKQIFVHIFIPVFLFKSPAYYFLVYMLPCGYIYSFTVMPVHYTLKLYERSEKLNINLTNEERQMVHTANFCTDNFIISYFTYGNNYQIEHHLSPSTKFQDLKDLQKKIKIKYKEKNIEYIEYNSWFGGIIDHLRLPYNYAITKKRNY